MIATEEGQLLYEAAYFLGRQTNNAAEYLALIHALKQVERYESQSICIYSDSELLVRQISGQYRVKSPKLAQLYQQAQLLLLKVSTWSIRHLPREENTRADELANLAMDQQRNIVVLDIGSAGSDQPDLEEQSGATDYSTPAVQPSPGKSSTMPESPVNRAVRIVVTRAPNAEVCPSGGCSPANFTVESVLPAKLCVHAAHAILPTLLAILNTEPQEFAAVPTLTVHCTRPGCGAVFHLSPVRSSNGKKHRAKS